MRTESIRLYVAFVLGVFSLNAAVASIYISQASLFLSESGPSYQDDRLGDYDPIFAPQVNTFESNGFGVVFDSNLTNNLGTMTWSITNNTGGDVASSQLMGFLDADLGVETPGLGVLNYFDEYGEVFGPLDSWEIDEPGFLFGDIYQHLQDTGVLDNTNNVPVGSPEDVSLALGFEITNWLVGETIIATFLISEALNGQAGLGQFDTLTDDVLYFSGSVENIGVIPIPGSAGLMLSGLVLLAVARYRRKTV